MRDKLHMGDTLNRKIKCIFLISDFIITIIHPNKSTIMYFISNIIFLKNIKLQIVTKMQWFQKTFKEKLNKILYLHLYILITF